MPQTTIKYRTHHFGRTLPIGIAAGFAGGAAEVAWIALYAQLSGTDAAAVANGVTVSLIPALAAAPAAVPLGIALHMALALLLGAAIAVLLRTGAPRLAGTLWEALAVIGLLVAVWAVNFLVVLPVINPGFVELVPLGVGLASKVLFGAAAASVLSYRSRRRAE
ncbi:MAG: hypothetical protein ACE5EU_05820 [Paracoccaceae bacterium]